MQLTAWKNCFLIERGLKSPSGKPLFTYRMNDVEFKNLETTLSNYLKDNLRYRNLAEIAKDDQCFSPAFVIYCSEWWKRKFNGSHWSWTPILNDLGAPPDGWSQARRSDCIERGLISWRLTLSSIVGFHYLGNVAYNGGLPLALVGNSHGNLAKLIIRIIKTNDENESIQSLIEQISFKSTYLPQAYQRVEIYTLIAELCLSLYSLKREAKLDNYETTIDDLDERTPGWRSRLPITADDDQAKELLSNVLGYLVNAKQASKKSTTDCFRLLRRIEKDEDNDFSLFSYVAFQKYLEASVLATVFNAPDLTKEQGLSLVITRGGEQVIIGLRKLAGQDRFKCDLEDRGCYNDNAAALHTIRLDTRDGRSFSGTLIDGEQLENDSPWLFDSSSDDDFTNDCPFLFQGSGSTSSGEAIVCILSNVTILNPDLFFQPLEIGKLKQQDRLMYKVQGSIEISDQGGSSYKIAIGKKESDISYFYRGLPAPDEFYSPSNLFLGVPELWSRDDDGKTEKHSFTDWRRTAGPWNKFPLTINGPIQARNIIDGSILWNGRFGVLPEDFSYKLLPSREPGIGSLLIQNADLKSIKNQTEGIAIECFERSCSTEVKLSSLNDIPPEKIMLALYWPCNFSPVRLKIPFPAYGIMTFDSTDKLVRSGLIYTLDGLLGIRINVYSFGKATGSITIQEIGAENKNRTYYKFPLMFSENQTRLQIRPISYIPEIKRIQSDSYVADSRVRFTIDLGDSETFFIDVTKYIHQFECLFELEKIGLPNVELGISSEAELSKVGVLALRMNSRGSEPIELIPIRSEGVHTGYWCFPASKLDSGLWLIYPNKDSKDFFCPMVWNIEASTIKDIVSVNGNLAKALSWYDDEMRELEFNRIVDDNNDCFLDVDWQLSEWLLNQTSYLAFSSVFLWKYLMRSPKFLATFAFSFNGLPKETFNKFCEEMGVIWQRIDLFSWVKALHSVRANINTIVSDPADVFFKAHVTMRIEDISLEYPDLKPLLDIAFKIVLHAPDDRISFIRSDSPQYKGYFKAILFSGADSKYQDLLRRRTVNDKWPVNLMKNSIASIDNDISCTYLYKDADYFQLEVINTPIMMALHVMRIIDIDFDSYFIESLKQIIRFDPIWFNEAFINTILGSVSVYHFDSIQNLRKVN